VGATHSRREAIGEWPIRIKSMNYIMNRYKKNKDNWSLFFD
jgi:hypothetical protein